MTVNIIEISSIKDLLEEENFSILREVLNEMHPADLVEVFEEITLEEKKECFKLLTIEKAGSLLDELDESGRYEMFSTLDLPKVLEILEFMPNDAVVDLLGEIPEKTAEDIIKNLPKRESEEIRELMSYPEDTAGGIMTSEYLKLISDMTVEQTLEYLRMMAGSDNIAFYYLYVVDRNDILVGVVGLRTLITSPPYLRIEEIMNRDVITVNIEDDQEIVADVLQKYDFLMLPVVDVKWKLKGIVTWDDAQDVLEEEVTEDIYSSSGIHVQEDVDVEDILKGKLSTEIKARAPWLMLTLVAEFMAVYVAHSFGGTLNALPVIAIFMPLMTGLGGNIGTQSVTIIVRSLYTGQITLNDSMKCIFREITAGLIIGSFFGFIVFLISQFFLHDAGVNSLFLGIIVGMSMLLTMTIGASLGTIVPFLMEKLKLDPAVASGPLIATGIDVIGLAIYFTLVTIMISLLPVGS